MLYIVRRPVDSMNGLFEFLYFTYAYPLWSCDISRASRFDRKLAYRFASLFSGAEVISV